MPFLLRLRATAFSSSTRRAAHPGIRQPLSLRSLSSTPSRFAQGYGDGEGDPKGEKPQDQGASNSTKENAEHPGPESPVAGSGAGPTKSRGSSKPKSPEESSANSGGSRSKEAKETGSSPTGGEVGSGSGGPSPKIHNTRLPGENSQAKQAEVEEHNKEFEKRHDREASTEGDKVDKKFWSGDGREGVEGKV
ncbi:hypothetical protein LHYA1_G002989 [Lachnellula hyalina]|uniref:Uncharacterized protein n=1 Tax=Lachnellula hyalina TaxID=1316788 RepID=A0A8H8TYN1_9HELO|nr:uncharacterized protein LHYA1_G002989 [Lachnellula hyalina]TVY27339.1 hypothetical protein LHYA1_G002989 [Lachnellula hyalina]